MFTLSTLVPSQDHQRAGWLPPLGHLQATDHRQHTTQKIPHCPHSLLPRITNEPDGSHRWVTFSTSSGSPSSVQFFEVDEVGACVAESSHVLEGVNLAFVHDLAVTENYYVIILGSVEVSGWAGGPFSTAYV